jgi:hypothetical protein
MPVAMVYKDDGPVSLECTTEAVADCLRDAGWDVVYVGPKERVRALSAEVLRQVDLYVQPGGGDDYDEAWAVRWLFLAVGLSMVVMPDRGSMTPTAVGEGVLTGRVGRNRRERNDERLYFVFVD